MKMVFRWFGENNDTVSLNQIRQIPGVEGIVWSLHDVPAGEEWPMDKIMEVKAAADEAGLHMKVVESVNIHEDIKLGLPSRDIYIANYKKTIAKLARSTGRTVSTENLTRAAASDLITRLSEERYGARRST